jgi:beta-lactamase regulating signal transducer with metallopeptidase domain
MNAVLKIFLSMSFSGSLLILILLLGKQFLKNKISRQWQYYIWLVVVLRLLLPFGPEVSLMGKTYRTVDQAISQAALLPPQQQPPLNVPGGNLVPAVGAEHRKEMLNSPADDVTTTHPFQDIGVLLINHIWLVVALGLLIRKITIYQGFVRYIKARLTPVSDIEQLDELSIVAEQSGIKKPVELCVNPLVSSPLLLGLFHPCIVLPRVDILEKDFRYIVLHELTHYKRCDMFYKWLVQVTVCLHWFNPLVHLMSREITKACEFSCDEAVLTKMGSGNAQDYGKTLLDAMAAVGRYKENFGAVTLSENKHLLKERINAIMNFKKKSTAIRFLTGALTLCVMFGAAFVGVYPVDAAVDRTAGKLQVVVNKTPAQGSTGTSSEDYAAQAEQYYKADSLPLFEITFPRLNENTQKMWLEKLYADGDVSFFSVSVRGLDTNSSLFADFAEKAYTDKELAFFSVLTDCMGEAELELWLDRALEDGNWAFQSMLFDKLNQGEEFDELEEKREKEWAEAQMAEYQAVGVTMDGKDYYYQGQLVNIFLDIRSNKSFHTLNMNPKGTVNIKIVRDVENKITGVSYMTEAEVMELLGDMDDPG